MGVDPPQAGAGQKEQVAAPGAASGHEQPIAADADDADEDQGEAEHPQAPELFTEDEPADQGDEERHGAGQ